jgi:2,4-dienoyl-CoA reductase-like NADH-dependent reductase (Old Yellow Enzyme family)
MNKRINLLAIQAGGIWQGGYVEQANGDSVYTEHKFVHGGDMDVEQFARLLIQECIDIVGIGGEFASRPKLVQKLQETFRS